MKRGSTAGTLRRTLLAAAFPLLAVAGHAQLNIGSTAAPTNSDAALQVNSGSSRGLLFPRVALTGTASAAPLSAHVKGMTVYNTASTGDVLPGFYSNDGSKWVSIVASTPSSPSLASTTGTPLGVKVGLSTAPDAGAALEVTSMNNNKGLLLPLVNLSSTTSPSPLGAATAGMMVYNIVTSGDVCPGTYVNNGSAWLRLESPCAVTPPAPGVVPTNVTLAQNQRYWIASVHDANYLPYTAQTGPAILPGTPADNASTPSITTTTADYQGKVTTTGVTVSIPATGSGTVNAYSNTIRIPAEYAEDGISRQLTLSWASQSVSASTPYITATITSVGGDFLAKKLDVNTGIGSDHLGFLLGAFQYPYNSTGTLTGYQVRDIPGIPDRMFGIADNAGDVNSHLMLYLPVQAEDGKVWLNNNLGADYTNLNKSGSFNLAQQATGDNDALAFGSLFQWGRKPDGHELMTYTSSTGPGTPVNGTTSTLSDNPTNALFIAPSNGYGNWWASNIPYPTFWQQQGTANVNNPCPSGFRVPTTAEYTTWISAAGITNSTTAASSALKLTTGWPNYGGFRYYSYGGITGSNVYWTSTYSASGYYDGVLPDVMQMNPTTAPMIRNKSFSPANGLIIRCIQQ